MKTIKVIDLLQRIANKEEVPKKIIVEGIKYSIVNEGYPHTYKDINGYEIEDNHSKYIIDSLNDEVEIIEDRCECIDKEVEKLFEEKEIEELELNYDDIKYGTDFKGQILSYCDNLQFKINELVREVNKLKNK